MAVPLFPSSFLLGLSKMTSIRVREPPGDEVMSEYQYYEFQAMDRPLDEHAQAALRALSTRARITPTSLVNVYHFGDFKGDPDQLMDRYFDAHLYVANWGSRRLMLRLPARSFPLATAKPYTVPSVLTARGTKEHVVLDFHSVSDEGDEDFEDFEGGESWLATLISLRSDLLAGDLRCLYLGWLAAVQNGDVNENKTEPIVPPGLRQLSAPLRRFMDFLRLDPDLFEIAAAISVEAKPSSHSTEELAAWIASLPVDEKDSVLVRLMQSEAVSLASELLQRFHKDHAQRQVRTGGGEVSREVRRTAGSLIEARDRLAEEKDRMTAERAAKEQAERAREQMAARARHLDTLSGREQELWRQVETAIKLRQPKEYDQAVEWLQDLRDLAERSGTVEDFVGRLRELRERHRSKPSLMRRLDRIGLPS